MKRTVNRVLKHATGYQLTRVPEAAIPSRHKRVDRLVQNPTFILTSVRSGSTLLRSILDSHSEICAPHELHLRLLRITIGEFGERAANETGLDARKLEYLLWDRMLHRELTASNKKIVVEKTPNMVFEWQRLQEAWPEAKFIFLLRHPAGLHDALMRVRKDGDVEYATKRVLMYGAKIDEARANLPGLTVKYEELVAEPERVVSGICEFLGVPWEPAMLNYGDFKHGRYVSRLGDWGPKIKSGRIDSNIVVPSDDEVPEALVQLSRDWGYLK